MSTSEETSAKVLTEADVARIVTTAITTALASQTKELNKSFGQQVYKIQKELSALKTEVTKENQAQAGLNANLDERIEALEKGSGDSSATTDRGNFEHLTRISLMEDRMRRCNLRFTHMPLKSKKYEDCKSAVLDAVQTSCGYTPFSIHNAHTVGRSPTNDATIIVAFVNLEDKSQVLRLSGKYRKFYEGTSLPSRISEDFSKFTLDCRDKLYDYGKTHLKDFKLRYNLMYCDGLVYDALSGEVKSQPIAGKLKGMYQSVSNTTSKPETGNSQQPTYAPTVGSTGESPLLTAQTQSKQPTTITNKPMDNAHNKVTSVTKRSPILELDRLNDYSKDPFGSKVDIGKGRKIGINAYSSSPSELNSPPHQIRMVQGTPTMEKLKRTPPKPTFH